MVILKKLVALQPLLALVAADTVAVKFEKVPRSRSGTLNLAKRASTYSVNIDNTGTSYLINVTIGSNSQPFNLILDTGSSDLWVPSSNNPDCQGTGASYYCPYGTFDASSSTSFRNTSEDFFIQYGDGTTELGYYFTDNLNIGSLGITNTTMAAATYSQSQNAIQGIMGVGFTSNEASNASIRAQLGLNPSTPFTYPSVIDNMVSEGKISAKAYSLWLDDFDANTGTVLFGGVDSSKYTGDLVALPIQNDAQSGAITSFTVALTGLVVEYGNGKSDNLSPSSALPALLDSGTTLTYLPDEIVTSINNGVGAVNDEQMGPIAPCTIAANNFTFVYSFGGTNGATVSVPLSALLYPLVYSDYTPVTSQDGTPICQWGIISAGEGPVILGDSFLRSAYVVYDLENLQIGLAQTNFNANGGGNGKEISSSGIPGVTRTASGATVQATYTGEPRESSLGRASRTGTAPEGSATFPFSTSGTVGPTATGGGSGGSGGSTTGSGSSASSTVKNDAGVRKSNVALLAGLGAAALLV